MSDNILNSINIILEKLYKSVETNVYELLDKLINISPDIFKQEPLKYIFNDENKYGIVFVATSLIFFYVIQYMIMKLISMYNGNSPENIFKFVMKILITVIFASSSKYICQTVLEINSIFTQILASLGEKITGNDVSFKEFSEVITNIEKYMSNDNVGIDGLIKGFISFGAVTLLINYSVRYVTIIFCIITMPLAIMFSISPSTKDIFNSWLKIILINLCQQWIVTLLLIIPISFKDINDQMFKIVILGTIYLLYKINIFTKEFLGTIYINIKKGVT